MDISRARLAIITGSRDRQENQAGKSMSRHTGGFKNIKLGKNVHRQVKRRGAPSPPSDKTRKPNEQIRPKHRF